MHRERVLVCGGGLAGLTAAHELARARADVTLVEARNRLGGRIWTVREGFASGQHAELGGEFIDAEHRHMRALAERFRLELVPVLRSGFMHRFRPAGGDFEISRTAPWDLLRQVLGPLIQRYKAAGGEAGSDDVRDIAKQSLRGWLEEQRAESRVHAMARAVRGFFLADPEELSVLQVVELLADGEPPSHVRMFRIAGGNDRLIAALVRETPARMLVRHHVHRVVQTGGRVIVHVTDERGRLQEIDADAIVIALPASTLRHIEFVPSLPADRRRAIAAVRYGRSTKVVVQTTSHVLRERRSQAFATDTPLGAFWDATDGQPSRAHSIINFLAGGSASPQLQQRARHGAEDLLSDLCWLGLAGATVTAWRAATWEDDPLACGGYAFSDTAFDPAWRPLLSRSADRMFFAGEHTSEDFQGYMEGAVQSGMRAAAEVLDSR